MKSKWLKSQFIHLSLYIFLTVATIFGSNAHSEIVSCSSVFSFPVKEFTRADVLLEFLSENPGLNISKRFSTTNEGSKINNIAEYYSTEEGHAQINKTEWTRDYLNPNAKLVGDLTYYLSEGTHHEINTFAGATFSKTDFKSFVPGQKYTPHYFFSTTKDIAIAKRFMNEFGNQNSPKSHIKIFFEITGISGRDLTKQSKFDEAEVLYPPDAEFVVQYIRRYPVHNKNGFEVYKVRLKEERKDPPKYKLSGVGVTAPDLLRLESRDNYEREIKSGNMNPLSIYPQEDLKAFQKAIIFVNSATQSNRELSVNLLKQIHEIALEGHIFEGYYRRRVRFNYLQGKVTKEDAFSQLQNIQNHVDDVNKYLPGNFRKVDIDNYVMTGLDIDSSGHRGFKPVDLYMIATNSFFRIEKDSVRKVPRQLDMLDAEVLLLPVEMIEPSVEALIKKARKELAKAQSNYEYTMTVLKLQKSLISIHPFHDGNGRAIKLLSDFLYLKRGIAPPLHANNSDYTLPINELYRQTVREMELYINGK